VYTGYSQRFINLGSTEPSGDLPTVDETSNWKPDPFGAHELRFFSADGKPTLLVMDGGKRSYDKPPADWSENPSAMGQSNPDLMDQSNPDPMPEPQVHRAPPPLDSVIDPAPDYTPQSPPDEAEESHQTLRALESTSEDNDPHVVVAAPVQQPAPRSAQSLLIPPVNQPPPDPGSDQPEPMSRSLKIAYAIVLGLLTLSLLGLAYVHLPRHSGQGRPTGLAASTTTSIHATSTSINATTTTVLPKTLSPSAEAAASALVSSWSANDRSAALTIATPTAVETLFSVPYASGLAIARGCSTSFSPIVCTYGPPGGASPTDAIYQIMVSQVQGGWYVSSVRIEN
jgi:hypothetical protein